MQWYYGFDFGADTLRMADTGGDLKQEAAWAAFRGSENTPFAWGDRAYTFLGREANGVRLRQCMQGGVPLDPELMRRWVLHMLGSGDRSLLRRRRALIALSPLVPDSVREYMLTTVLGDSMDMVGAVPMDMAAGLGAGADIMGENGCFLMDIGASHMTLSVIAGGRRVRVRSLPYGMDQADEQIIDRVRCERGLVITRRVARLLKHSAFSDSANTNPLPVFDPLTRLPRYEQLDASIAQDSLNEIVAGILDLCKGAMSGLSPELSEDAARFGIVLTGGGSLLGGLDVCLKNELQLPVTAAQSPREAVWRGLDLILKQPELYSPLIIDWREGSLRL